jgi:predicted Zn finger-like uncharacterized protein
MFRVVIVSCPACATRFSLDAALLGTKGRTVRCAKCSHKWKQVPPPDEAPAESPAESPPVPEAAPPAESPPMPPAPTAAVAAAPEEPAPTAPETVAPPRARPDLRPTGPITVPPKLRPMAPSKRTGYIPLVLMLGVLVGLLAAGYFFSGAIARVVPGADMIYRLIGLSASDPTDVLQLGNLKTEMRGTSVLSIRGELFNPSEYPQDIPPMMVILSDKEGKQIGVMPFRLQEARIEPGETISFRKIYQDPPGGTQSVAVNFGKF